MRKVRSGRSWVTWSGVACALALTIGTGAAATFICAYTESIFGLGGWPVKIALFAVIIGIHLRGVGEAMGLTFIAGVIAVVALLTFGVAMAPHVELTNLLTVPANVATPGSASAASSPACRSPSGCSSPSSKPARLPKKRQTLVAPCRAAFSRPSALCW